MGYRQYGEDEQKESPIRAFFLGFFLGALLYDGGLWIFASCGWISQMHLRLICCGLGVILGMKLAHGSWRRIKQQKKENKL